MVTNVSDEFNFTGIKPDISFEIFHTVAKSLKNIYFILQDMKA